jgi:hypothetical protein
VTYTNKLQLIQRVLRRKSRAEGVHLSEPFPATAMLRGGSVQDYSGVIGISASQGAHGQHYGAKMWVAEI